MRLIFFFQAEDGIRDADVTGVQTCALPISARVRRTSPARSSTFTCFETALKDMSKGWARSVTRAAPFANRWTIFRRVGSESATKARSRTGGAIYSTYGLNIATGPPLSSDRR